MKAEDLEFKKTSHMTTEKWYETTYYNKEHDIYKSVQVHRDSIGMATDKVNVQYAKGLKGKWVKDIRFFLKY